MRCAACSASRKRPEPSASCASRSPRRSRCPKREERVARPPGWSVRAWCCSRSAPRATRGSDVATRHPLRARRNGSRAPNSRHSPQHLPAQRRARSPLHLQPCLPRRRPHPQPRRRRPLRVSLRPPRLRPRRNRHRPFRRPPAQRSIPRFRPRSCPRRSQRSHSSPRLPRRLAQKRRRPLCPRRHRPRRHREKSSPLLCRGSAPLRLQRPP
jgi:hypothetical protein